MGVLSGADSAIFDEHERGWMDCFADEYERYGGPHIDKDELLLKYQLFFSMCASDTCQWIERDTLREMPKEEWKDITHKLQPKFQNTWNARTRTTTFINLMDF